MSGCLGLGSGERGGAGGGGGGRGARGLTGDWFWGDGNFLQLIVVVVSRLRITKHM